MNERKLKFSALIRTAVIVTALAFASSCKKEKWFGGPNFFREDFEDYASIDSMFSSGDVNWSFHQNTVSGNFIAFDTTIVHSGTRSLKFFAHASTASVVSKCSIVKQKMAFYEGDVVRMSAWYYIEGNAPLDWLFLFDLEEQAAVGAGPGMRLANTETGICVEHKFMNDDLYQEGNAIALPRNQWFNLTMEVRLSQKKKGYVKVWQNNQLILEGNDRKTLPTDFLYSQQGTKGMYQSVEFGITANTKNSDVILYVDDVVIEKIN